MLLKRLLIMIGMKRLSRMVLLSIVKNATMKKEFKIQILYVLGVLINE